MKIIIPLEAFSFKTHMVSMEYFDFKNMQVITYYPYSHLGFAFIFHIVLDIVLYFSDLRLILLKDKLRHIKHFKHLFE